MEQKKTETAWCYDVRTGWAEVEDVVWSGCPASITEDAKALSRAGFTTEFFNLGKDSFRLEFAVYRNETGTGPLFYVRFSADDNVEWFYLANLPSLLAWLKDVAPILQAVVSVDSADKPAVPVRPARKKRR
jgi:hypothetical protein